MQSLRGHAVAALLVLGSAAVAAGEAEAAANPLGQVVKLLDGLAAKIAKEGEAEEKAYKAYVEWCDEASTSKGFEIKTATSQKEELQAAIGKSFSDAEATGAKIEELAASIAADESELKSASGVREKEAADFSANEAELADVIDTIGRAITLIQREMSKNPASFAQMDVSNAGAVLKSLEALVDAAAFSGADKQKLLAMMQSQESSDDEEFGAPAAAAYKSHSSSILDVLEDMKEKAEGQLSELRKAETSAKHNYAMLKQSLEDSGAADAQKLAEEKAAKAAASESKATSEAELAVTAKDLADAKGALETAKGSCAQAAANNEASQKARTEELAAISKAKEILQESTTGAVGQTYSLLQQESHAASQLRTRADLAGAEVVTVVKRLAREQHSMALGQLASRIATIMRYGSVAGEDPFQKVKALLTDLVSKLEAEAQGEASEKAYCDEQLAETEEKKGELDHDLSKLTAKIDQGVSKAAALKAEVKELQEELATLAKEQAEMGSIRRESHAAYVQAKADLEAGLKGVRKALSVLKKYYGGAAAAMLQAGQRLPEVMESGAYSKATGAGTTIIAMLEVVESDFAKGLAKEEVAEDDAETDYQKTTQANKVTTNLKQQDVKYKSQEAKQLDKSVAELTADRETADSELSAVLEYYAKIKERCIAKPETYEDRAAKRTAEIAGLKEALAILEDQAVFVQSRKKALRGHYLGVTSE